MGEFSDEENVSHKQPFLVLKQHQWIAFDTLFQNAVVYRRFRAVHNSKSSNAVEMSIFQLDMSSKTNRWIEIVAHLIFWIGIFLLFIQPASNQTVVVEKAGEVGQVINEGKVQWVFYGVSAFIFYFNILLLYPLLLSKNRFWEHLISLTASIAVIIIVEYIFFDIYFTPLAEKFSKTASINHSIFGSFSLMYILVKNQWRVLQKQREIELDRLSNELEFLKSQLNPHFLFNSINNIFSIAQKNEDEAVANHIASLSKTLRYTLYENNEREVPLAKEIEFLDSYIDMTLLKYDEGQIDFVYEKRINNDHVGIAPSLLIPLVENAFKHGLRKKPNIKIYITTDQNLLSVHISNTYDHQSKANPPVAGGIGLKNLRRRLELLYPGKHKLSITDKNGIFEVDLNIQLNGI